MLVIILMIPATAFIALQSDHVQTFAAQKVLSFLSDNIQTTFTLDKINIGFFNRVIVEKLYVEDLNGDTLLYADKLTANVSKLNIRQKKVTIQRINLEKSSFNLKQDSLYVINIKFLFGKKKGNKSGSPWDISIKSIGMTDSRFSYSTYYKKNTEKGIDFTNLRISDLNIDVKRFKPQGDTISFIIKSLSCRENSGFILTGFSSKTSICNNHFIFEDPVIKTPSTFIEGKKVNLYFNNYSDFKVTNLYSNINFDISLTGSDVNVEDLCYFVPALPVLKQKFKFSGDVTGPLNNLSGKKINIKFGNSSVISGELQLDGLPEIKETFIFARFNNIETNFDDLQEIELPGKKPAIPLLIKKLGNISYDGQFTGFINDFVAYGSINTELGLIKTDLLIKPDNKNLLSFNGSMVTENYDLGKLLDIENTLGKISVNINANGYSASGKTLNAKITGTANLLEFKNYAFKNITIAGVLEGKKYDGNVKIKDPNLDLDFRGLLDFTEETAEYDFFASVSKANLYALNIDKTDPTQTVSFDVKANAKGNNLNNIQGKVNLINSLFANKDKQIQIYDLKVSARDTLNAKKISLLSDFIDLEVTGNYEMNEIGSTFSKFFHNFFPAFVDSGKLTSIPDFKNRFRLQANLKNTKPLLDYFYPKYNIGQNTVINANFEPDSDYLKIFIQSPLIEAEGFSWRNVVMNIESDDTVLVLNSGSEKLTYKEKFDFGNFTLNSVTKSGISDLDIRWNNWDSSLYKGTLNARVSFEPTQKAGNPAILISLAPTKIVTYDSVWNLHECSVRIDNKEIAFNDVLVDHYGQYIKLFGNISENPANKLTVQFRDFNLLQINRLFNSPDFNIKGILNGEAVISDIYANPYFSSELKVDSLIINSEKLGNLSLNSRWNNNDKSIYLNAFANRGNLKTINIEGVYFPSGQGLLDFDIELNKLRLDLFEPYIKSIATGLKGLATGEIKLMGSAKKPLINGNILLQKAAFEINYLKTQYYFTHKINITDNNIYLDDLLLADEFGNTSVVNGSVTNNYFKNFKFNLSINADNFHFLNTTQADNSQFYGTAFATGIINISGSPKNVTMNITARTERNTRIFIPLSSQEEIVEYNFVSFIKPGEESSKETLNGRYKVNLSGIQMNFDLDVTPDAEVQIIFDQTVGEILKAKGSGNLKLQISTMGKFSMFGNYIVEDGDYRFTLMNFINRTFNIDPGGEIRWNGAPLDAEINMKAVYETKPSLSSLFGTTDTETDNTSKSTTVQCIIQMTEKLMSPKIKFEIEFPYLEEHQRAKIANEISTNEQTNRNFISLLVTGQFAVNENRQGNSESSPYSNVASGNASEFLSNQLSHWLSQINNNVGISVNLRNDKELKSNYVETALSTQLFNDKLTIYGNLDIPTNATARASSDIVGDVDLDYKITKSGKIRVKAFTHSEEDLDPTKLYTQGVGFVYKEEFNTFGELWRRYWRSVFKPGKNQDSVKN